MEGSKNKHINILLSFFQIRSRGPTTDLNANKSNIIWITRSDNNGNSATNFIFCSKYTNHWPESFKIHLVSFCFDEFKSILYFLFRMKIKLEFCISLDFRKCCCLFADNVIGCYPFFLFLIEAIKKSENKNDYEIPSGFESKC